jgi:uncharacterized protein YndB with AHSA1/START domain
MSTQESTLAPVHRSIVVATPAAHAFRVFTEQPATWWPLDHHLLDGDVETVVMEPRVDGRWYERLTDGRECDWGRVLVWEPPHRVVVTWQITPQFTAEPDPERASEVEVTFTPESAARTRVDLEHRHFERHGLGFADLRRAVDSPGGWTLLLEAFAARVPAG